jgi:hypothetical protein
MVENFEKSLLELDFASLRRQTFTPSPLRLDRFCDGKQRDGYRDNADRPFTAARHPCIGRGIPAESITIRGYAPAAAGRALGPSPPPDLRPWHPPRAAC